MGGLRSDSITPASHCLLHMPIGTHNKYLSNEKEARRNSSRKVSTLMPWGWKPRPCKCYTYVRGSSKENDSQGLLGLNAWLPRPILVNCLGLEGITGLGRGATWGGL